MPQQSFPRKPEVMSPAGHWPQLHAAVEAGADSVYFGLRQFTARAKVGFSREELPEALGTLHRRGVRGFVTLNTLVFDDELREAARLVAAVAEAGADAVIIQDVGMLRLAREVAPGLEIHASTQMSITDARGVRWAQSLGARRVTMARELSLTELEAIRAETDADLEVFVHGALCVAYSGQCFSSEAWGGRSANRGQCAQACRLPYELEVDGRIRPLGDARYLLSPGDLFALRQVPELTRLGIAALKIEGRYKDAEYVALTTRAYRQAVDAAWAGEEAALDRREELQLEQAYSRGLGPFFLTGTNHQAVVRGRAPRHRGVLLGRVARVAGEAVVVEPDEAQGLAPLKPGDGLVFDAADWRSPEEPEEGGRVFAVVPLRDGRVELRFGRGAIRPARIRAGDWVWRTHDPELEKAARPYTQASAPVRRQAVRVQVRAVEGERLRTEWSVAGVRVTVESPDALPRAGQRGVTVELLREQLGRLGNTAYELGELTLELAGEPFAPSSVLNQVRREAVEALQRAQEGGSKGEVRDADGVVQRAIGCASQRAAYGAQPDTVVEGAIGQAYGVRGREGSAPRGEWGSGGRQPGRMPRLPGEAPPHLDLLVRTAEQLEAAVAARPGSVTLDYLDLYGLRPSVERVRAAGVPVRVASPRVLKPGEEKIADFLRRLECPVLVRSAGLLEALGVPGGPALVGDFSLNAANAVAARALLGMGLERLTPTHDLNAAQVAALARSVGADRLEAVAYQHLPVFHTEHCVFCRFLSSGTSYRDCGRPCEEHRVALRDERGRAHPVLADVGCRNTVFGAEAQEASAHLEAWREAGVRHFRLEFAHESGEQVREVARAFEGALEGRMSGAKLGQVLRRVAPAGTTEGSLQVGAFRVLG